MVHLDNLLPADVQMAIDAMNIVDADFYLTGSRFFGIATENSDYDFFTEVNPEILKFLAKAGFHALEPGDNGYAESADTKIIMGYLNVHIQLVTNAKRKWNIQKALKDSKWAMSALDKNTRSLIWSVALKFAPENY